MKKLMPLFLIAILAGCKIHGEPTKTETAGKDFSVETLFTDADGYTVKRFHDGGRARYYVVPGPARVVNHWTTTRHTGKVIHTDHHDEEIDTAAPNTTKPNP